MQAQAQANIDLPTVLPQSALAPRVTNRLVLMPQGVSSNDGPMERDQLVSLVRQIGGSGETYIYVAAAGQKEAEDNEAGVRFLPLTPERLPCFSTVESVLVFNDKAMAAAAAAEYPMAAVFHIKSMPNN